MTLVIMMLVTASSTASLYVDVGSWWLHCFFANMMMLGGRVTCLDSQQLQLAPLAQAHTPLYPLYFLLLTANFITVMVDSCVQLSTFEANCHCWVINVEAMQPELMKEKDLLKKR